MASVLAGSLAILPPIPYLEQKDENQQKNDEQDRGIEMRELTRQEVAAEKQGPKLEEKTSPRQSPREPLEPDFGNTPDYTFGRSGFYYVTLAVQAVLFFLFLALVDHNVTTEKDVNSNSSSIQRMRDYPLYQDVHVMVFIGFGFVAAFLHKYGFSAVGFNFVIAALCIQWSLIINGLMQHYYQNHVNVNSDEYNHLTDKIEIGVVDLIQSDFAAGAVLISLGALMGKVSPMQMVFIALLELTFYSLNVLIGKSFLGAEDAGGSIFVHTFGAYFGLAVSKILTSAKPNSRAKSHRQSDMYALVGTLFLWVFWPSFNGALVPEAMQSRVVVNTVLALSASCSMAFMLDLSLREDHKFTIMTIQNATLAGGVAIGASADVSMRPWSALLLGICAGAVSVLGYVYVQPVLERHANLDDTCGVHNLHGMPGIIGGLRAALTSAASASLTIGTARQDCPKSSSSGIQLVTPFPCGRTSGEQTRFQLIALVVTIVVAVVGGLLTGVFLKIPFFVPSKKSDVKCTGIGQNGDERQWYDDSLYWRVGKYKKNK